MIRYAATVSYDGSLYCGWQIQPDVTSVQEVFEHALFSLAGKKTSVTAAGRTDAGVHSKGQVVSFALDADWREQKLLLAMNAHLPLSVRVTEVRKVPSDFHARRSALWREYRYFVWHGSFCYPHIANYVWWNKRSWNIEKVRECCSVIQGEHDFSAFCRVSECPENSVRRILKMKVFSKNSLTVFQIRGDAFLTNMVRIMMGNIHLVGTGKYPVSWLEGLLHGGSRVSSGATAPPEGLFLWKVGYDLFSS
jgi:tRNA pseudouridine38-40 synthase